MMKLYFSFSVFSSKKYLKIKTDIYLRSKVAQYTVLLFEVFSYHITISATCTFSCYMHLITYSDVYA